MRTLVWSTAFVRAFRRVIRHQPTLREKVEQTLNRLVEDPFQSALRSHKLKGLLAGVWACSVDYNCRIIFEFVQSSTSEEDDIFLLTIGSHDDVY